MLEQTQGRQERATRTATEFRTRRFTIEVPYGLAEHVEICCARRGVPVEEVLQQLVAREFPVPPEAEGSGTALPPHRFRGGT